MAKFIILDIIYTDKEGVNTIKQEMFNKEEIDGARPWHVKDGGFVMASGKVIKDVVEVRVAKLDDRLKDKKPKTVKTPGTLQDLYDKLTE